MTYRCGKTVVALFALCLGTAAAFAEDKPAAPPQMSAEMQAMMEAYAKAGTPGPEHKKLAEAAGDYTATVKSWMGPGEPMVSQGEVHREMTLDGRVLVETFKGSMMGQPFVGHGMAGYDNARKMHWSTWVDSMSTGMMMSWGVWDAKENALVFTGEMTDAMTGKPMQLKMISRHPAGGDEVFEMWENQQGQQVKTMEITYKKKG